MNLADLKKIADWAASAPISEIEVVDGDFRVVLTKRESESPSPAAGADNAPTVQRADVHITAPVFGLFYLSPSPEAAPFVTVGQTVKVGDTVGVVEAMKMFNPVLSEVEGTIEAVLVESGGEVEPGQALFSVVPSGQR